MRWLPATSKRNRYWVMTISLENADLMSSRMMTKGICVEDCRPICGSGAGIKSVQTYSADFTVGQRGGGGVGGWIRHCLTLMGSTEGTAEKLVVLAR